MTPLSRASWKRLRRQVEALPEGKRLVCECGGFLVYQMDEPREGEAESGEMSHTLPHCPKYLQLEELLRNQGKLRYALTDSSAREEV